MVEVSEYCDIRKFETPINTLDYIKSITSEHGKNADSDPFYIVDLEDICNKHVNWITKLPRVEPHYAVKCNTDPLLLKLLAYLGTGFDCASKNEIQKILDIGVSPDRIIFANPCKQNSYIKYAHKVGVNYMTFDNEYELMKIKENHPNAKCVLRIFTDDKDAVCRFSIKFGADMATSMQLVELALQMNINLVGVSFHVGSGQKCPKAFSEAIHNARKLFDYAREEFGCRMHLLDLGGGYPGSSSEHDLFDAITVEINKALATHFDSEFFTQLYAGQENKLRIIAEPGRYYTCSSFTLAVNVIAKRIVNNTDLQEPSAVNKFSEIIDDTKSVMYYINDGVYASFNCLFYDHAECLPIVINDKHMDNKMMYKSSIWGATCDGLDVVVKDCLLPTLDIGEYLVFKDMGAYTLSGAVAFNGIPLAKCIYTASTSWEAIKGAFIDEIRESNLFKDEVKSTCALFRSVELDKVATSKEEESSADSANDSTDDINEVDVIPAECVLTC